MVSYISPNLPTWRQGGSHLRRREGAFGQGAKGGSVGEGCELRAHNALHSQHHCMSQFNVKEASRAFTETNAN